MKVYSSTSKCSENEKINIMKAYTMYIFLHDFFCQNKHTCTQFSVYAKILVRNFPRTQSSVYAIVLVRNFPCTQLSVYAIILVRNFPRTQFSGAQEKLRYLGWFFTVLSDCL